MSYWDALKPDARSKEIAREIGEDPAQKMSHIETLRSWIVTHPWLQCRTDDTFLLRFLRVSKFSCEAAKERIIKFCLMRTSKLDGMPEWFENQNPEDEKIREVISSGMFYLMPKPDDLGRLVMVFDMEAMSKIKMDPVLFVRALYVMFDWMLFTFDRAQLNGAVLIEVGSNTFDMEQLKYWTPERTKKSVEIFQGAMPGRFKMIYYYNMPVVMKTFIEIMMKFMKPKMAKRIRFHSDHKRDEHVPEECMPPSLDGTGPQWDEIKEHMLKSLDEFQSEFDSFARMCKVDDAKMPKKYEEGDSWGITGTYRTIANAAD